MKSQNVKDYMEIDKGRLLKIMIDLPYPMSCMPIGQQQIFAFIFMALEDTKRRNR